MFRRLRDLGLRRRLSGAARDFGERVRALDWRRRLALAGILVLTPVAVVALALVGSRADEPAEPAPAAAAPDPADKPKSFLVDIVPPPAGERRRREPRAPQLSKAVSERLRAMPIEQKVAQLFIFGFEGQDLTADVFVRLRRLGFGGIAVGPGNYTSSDVLAALSGEVRVIAEQEGHVQPFVMAEQEGGEFNSFPDLPPATTASLLPDVETAAAEADQAARTLRSLGVTGVFGPLIDVASGPDAAVAARAYSDDPEAVTAYAELVVEAYRNSSVFHTVRHFPGLGSAAQSTRVGPANVGLSLEELSERDLAPFRAAFEAGAPAVLLSHGLYAPDEFVVPGSLSRRIVTGLLRDRLGFQGVAVTDDLADPAITALGSIPDAAAKALRAGADMLYISGGEEDQRAAYDAVLAAVRGGDVPSERLDQAVGRVLSAKEDYGLLAR